LIKRRVSGRHVRPSRFSFSPKTGSEGGTVSTPPTAFADFEKYMNFDCDSDAASRGDQWPGKPRKVKVKLSLGLGEHLAY